MSTKQNVCELLWDESRAGITLESPESSNRTTWVAHPRPIGFVAHDFLITCRYGGPAEGPMPKLTIEGKARAVDATIGVLGTAARARSFRLVICGVDSALASSRPDHARPAVGQTERFAEPVLPESKGRKVHRILAELDDTFRHILRSGTPGAALWYTGTESRHGEEADRWWIQVEVPLETLEACIAAIKANRCHEIAVSAEFADLLFPHDARAGLAVDGMLLPAQANGFSSDAAERWVVDADGYPRMAQGAVRSLSWTERYPSFQDPSTGESADSDSSASRLTPPPSSVALQTPAGLSGEQRLPRIFWALVAIAAAIVFAG